MVAKDAQNHFYATFLERLQIFLAHVKDGLVVLVVVDIHATGFGVVVDVRREQNHGVDERLAAALEREADVVERVGVVHLHAAENLHARHQIAVGITHIFCGIRHAGEVAHQNHAILRRSSHVSAGGSHLQRDGIGCLGVEVARRSEGEGERRRGFEFAGSDCGSRTNGNTLLRECLEVGAVSAVIHGKCRSIVGNSHRYAGCSLVASSWIKVNGALLTQFGKRIGGAAVAVAHIHRQAIGCGVLVLIGITDVDVVGTSRKRHNGCDAKEFDIF